MKKHLLATLLLLTSCGRESHSDLTQTQSYLDIMPKAQSDYYKSLLPRLEDLEMQFVLSNPATMWYDHESIIPGYQDSMGDPEGMRPNTIESVLIDLAVPGGHARLFKSRGKFNFPFLSGGADRSDNVVKINFWFAPTKANNEILPVVYWTLNFSRWQWLFPRNTILGEVLMVKFPDSSLSVFEIRSRKRLATSWENKVFRPFPAAQELANAIQTQKPEWQSSPTLRRAVEHLQNPNSLQPQTLQTVYFQGTFARVDGHTDVVPDLGDSELAKRLLKEYPFRSVGSTVWKQNGSSVAYAASTASGASIVPRNYDAALLLVDDVSCKRCHQDAGRQIGHFQDELIAYGELWGEDEIFSWHPFDHNQFVDANGNVRNFNNDNRRVRSDFVHANLIKPYNRSEHTTEYYQAIPRSWTYGPIFKD